MIVSYASGRGRRLVMVDANPGILTLPTATLRSLDEVRDAAPMAPEPVPAQAGALAGWDIGGAGDTRDGGGRSDGSGPVPPPTRDPAAAPVSWRDAEEKLPPNLGPPTEPLDWRKRRKRRR
jgi:hypothetical protein